MKTIEEIRAAYRTVTTPHYPELDPEPLVDPETWEEANSTVHDAIDELAAAREEIERLKKSEEAITTAAEAALNCGDVYVAEIRRLREEVRRKDEALKQIKAAIDNYEELFGEDKYIKEYGPYEFLKDLFADTLSPKSTEAEESIKRGLKDAEEGRVHDRGDFTQYVDDTEEDK